MPTAVLMPKLGMSMAEGTVVEWLVDVGAPVEKGQPFLLIETEKAQVEVEAATAGMLRHIYVDTGETVPCGAVLAAVTETAEEPFDADVFFAAEAPKAPAKPAPPTPTTIATTTATTTTTTTPAAAAAGAPARRGAPVTPAARRRARELGVAAADVAGTGPGGRVTVEDIDAHAQRRDALVAVGDGVSLEVLTDGTGDPVLLLPGFGTDVSAFARQAPVLAAHFRVFGVNPRGVGMSDGPDDACYSVAHAARDAAAVVDAPAHVVGASLGSAVALEMALTQPERVRSLTLITPFVTASARLLAVCDAWCRLAANTDTDTMARALAPWFFGAGLLGDEAARDRTIRGLAQTLGQVPAATLRRAAAGLREWSGTRAADLDTISVPTLVIAAGSDLLTPDGEAVAAALPHATCVVIPDAGHAVGIEAPEAVNQAILRHVGAAAG